MFVACKIPNGFVISGAGRQVTLLGPNKAPDAPAPAGLIGKPMKELYGGYAITAGVESAVWEAWSRAASDSEVVQQSLVLADESLEALKAKCFRLTKTKSGMEQLPQRN
jgi:hypothetical protein